MIPLTVEKAVEFQAWSRSSSTDMGKSEGAGDGGGGTKLESGRPWVKESMHMAPKYLAASILDSLLLRLRVCMGWSSVLLKGVLSTQVAPTPEGRWKVFTSC